MREVVVAAVQFSCDRDRDRNLDRAEAAIRKAAADGATLVLLPELFDGPYFPKTQSPEYFERALPMEGHPSIERLRVIAAELGVVLPVSVFERAGQVRFNSVAVIDADGAILGVYRKSHIPDGPGYTEKFYFSPGDTGFRVWDTRVGRIGVGICWDQWFPEAARIMALRGAEILLYPTAIGSEPTAPEMDSSGAWQRVMQGHAAANSIPVVAANRHGHETEEGVEAGVDFYGSSFIADHTGEKVAEAPRYEDAILTATFDLDAVRDYRDEWGLFRDRRPDLYDGLLTLDGGSSGFR
ncbi:MAG: N-carbamoylputrescine amidase [Actinomycetota bacterium]|nr:N-carbamoylputrescine amidase [Actinomycetota bacterium]